MVTLELVLNTSFQDKDTCSIHNAKVLAKLKVTLNAPKSEDLANSQSCSETRSESSTEPTSPDQFIPWNVLKKVPSIFFISQSLTTFCNNDIPLSNSTNNGNYF